MDVPSAALIQDLIQSYGLFIVFMVIMLESVGIPMPGETVLVNGRHLCRINASNRYCLSRARYGHGRRGAGFIDQTIELFDREIGFLSPASTISIP